MSIDFFICGATDPSENVPIPALIFRECLPIAARMGGGIDPLTLHDGPLALTRTLNVIVNVDHYHGLFRLSLVTWTMNHLWSTLPMTRYHAMRSSFALYNLLKIFLANCFALDANTAGH